MILTYEWLLIWTYEEVSIELFEQVNATGFLTAIPTGGAHVTVIPTNGTVNQWMSQGQSSIWSQTLSFIVVEWDGGY